MRLSWLFSSRNVLRLTGTTLPPELKAYDFAEAYYIEDGGVVISPYNHGFYCPHGVETPEGIRIMPGIGSCSSIPTGCWRRITGSCG